MKKMLQLVLVACFLAGAGAPSAGADCPWIQNPATGMEYKVIKNCMSFEACQSAVEAVDEHAWMVTVTTEAEQNWIGSNLTYWWLWDEDECLVKDYWMGLTLVNPNQGIYGWAWATGEAFNWENWKRDIWGNPPDFGWDEPYGMVSQPTDNDFEWNDRDNEAEDDVIAERPICKDYDEDGYGSPANPTYCDHPELDCNDASAAVNPGSAETCGNLVDDDCDGWIDIADPDCWECTEAAECNDGSVCTNDYCVDHQCQHTPQSCDDGNACTADSCDPLTGCSSACGATGFADPCCNDPACSGAAVCEPPPECESAADCNDGSLCTIDSCVENACQFAAVNCDDGIGCTDDTCDPLLGCQYDCGAENAEDPCCEDPVCSSDPLCECLDADGDGYGLPESPGCPNAGEDCDDTSAAVNPGAKEVPQNAVDDDCDGVVDEPCFIATAAYGSELNARIDVLRTFRDRRLLTHPAGRAFVEAYYRTSPPLARFIAEHAWLRGAVRMLLAPVVGLVSLLV